MTQQPTVDHILRIVAPTAVIDHGVLEALLREHPQPEALMPLVAAGAPEVVRAAVLYLGICGSMRECPVLALCLRHDDRVVAQLAEYGLWSIWMQSGTAQGNRELAAAVACIHSGAYEDAIGILTRLLATEPSFAEAYFQCGLALGSADRPAEAAQAYRHTLRLNPYHFGAAAALGHACVEQGDLATAMHYYHQALRIHPRLEDVPAAVQTLESIMARQRSPAV